MKTKRHRIIRHPGRSEDACGQCGGVVFVLELRTVVMTAEEHGFPSVDDLIIVRRMLGLDELVSICEDCFRVMPW